MQDNLNTHNASSFYEQLPADEAFALAQRFTFHYTPKSASWLNMIEIEFSALARQCLHRRIPTLEQLEREVLALIQQRHDRRLTLPWQFRGVTGEAQHIERVTTDALPCPGNSPSPPPAINSIVIMPAFRQTTENLNTVKLSLQSNLVGK